jgi:hypothetical protein
VRWTGSPLRTTHADPERALCRCPTNPSSTPHGESPT